MSEKFPYLFAPIEIRGHVFRNRIVTAPTLFAHSIFIPEISENVYRMVEKRAKGGAAEVSTGEICVNFEEGRCSFVTPFDYNDVTGSVFHAFEEYARRIKKHGAVAMIEFCHEGAMADVEPGVTPWGPVAFTREDGVQAKALDEAMMAKICEDFARATRFMKKAGFDGILIHGGHGFLFQQFMSPLWNTRTDEYGGSMENRARFPKRILKAVREAAGEDMVMELRLSAEDGVPGGLTIDGTVEFCKEIDGDVDIIHVSNGLKWAGNRTRTFSDMFDPHGCNVEYAAQIKKNLKKTRVSVIGGINSPEYCNEIIGEGKTDFVVLGRQAYADPEFANKAGSGREDLIHRCVRCFQCYPGTQEHETDLSYEEMGLTPEEIGQRLTPAAMGRCAITPESDFRLYPETFGEPEAARRVLVIGGGVSGMQAAVTAAQRGHSVTLVEKTDRLGGILNFTDGDTYKADLNCYKETLKRELACYDNITIMMNTEADGAFIKEFKPDAMIVAVGSVPVRPPIDGLENAVCALDTYFGKLPPGDNVLMLGGGLVGCETALHLAAQGKKVTVVEMQPRLAAETTRMARTALMDEMNKMGITQLTGLKCLRIEPKGAEVEDAQGNIRFLKADSVCYSMGMESIPHDGLVASAGNIPVFETGDCAAVGKVGDATKAAYLAAMKIL